MDLSRYADLGLLSLGLAAVAHAALLGVRWRTARRLKDPGATPADAAAGAGSGGLSDGPAGRWLTLALLATVGWAGLGAVQRLAPEAGLGLAVQALDLARYALWFALLLELLRPGPLSRPVAGEAGRLQQGVAAVLLLAAGAWLLGLWSVHTGDRAGAPHTTGQTMAALALAVTGLVLIEQLFRNLPEDARWNAKPLSLGLGMAFGYDVYLYSDALLFGALDTDVLSVRGLVHALAVPLLLVATRRRGNWLRRLELSRAMAFQSATLVLVGGYLLFMAGVGYYVRYSGGEWGRALQVALLAIGGSALAVLMLSGSLRSRLKVFVGKHFFRYRYDYREEWLRFTQELASADAPGDVGTRVVRGLANLVECPAGDLWSTDGTSGVFRQVARWNAPAISDTEPADSALARFMADPGWVIDLREYRDAPRRYEALSLSNWMLTRGDLWLVVPLPVGSDLLGFVTLARPRAPVELNWEVRDLLKTAAQQAAGYLRQMQATEALLEARKFEAFNRMSAFVVHDLKNIVTQLSLMMRNAQRHHANPEFQQDMLLTVESSLEKMRRLMLQLREGAAPPGSVHGVDLQALLQRLAQTARAQGREVQTRCEAGLATRGHVDRLERVLGHLMHNALEATEASRRVWIHARRHSGTVQIEVGDEGVGMDEDFVRNQLFRPFNTTKSSGMGIGSFESLQYVRELGGRIDVDSRPGAGTCIRLELPLFGDVDAPAGTGGLG